MKALPAHLPANQIHLGDCADLLPKLPDGCAQLIIADPPYNLGPRFGLDKEWVRDEEWLPWCRGWLSECKRILAEDGNLIVYGIHHSQLRAQLGSAGQT